MTSNNLDFVCIYSFTLDAIRNLDYDEDKIDAYRKSMFDKKQPGRLRSYVSKEDYNQSIKEFDINKILEKVGSHYQEAEHIADQCAE